MEPATIAALLRELAVYYELDDDRHRAFAYDRAAKAVEAANGLHRLIEEGRLEELPGVGASIARVIVELARRGAGARAAAREVACDRDRAGAAAQGRRAEGAPDLPGPRVGEPRRGRGD